MNIADQILKLQDEAREHQAIYLGLKMEVAMLKGNRKQAEQYRRQMEGVIALRRVARFAQEERKAPCYFVTAGEADGGAIRA